MLWAPEQDAALKSVDAWVKDKTADPVFRLFGYAGTGKTTLAKHFAEGLGGKVLFAAYTGKAAHVLRSKGCPGASTIHSLIYHTKEKGKARLRELESSLVDLMQQLRSEGILDEQIAKHQRIIDIKKLIEDERKALSRPTFTRNLESEVLTAKLVIIDECSMVDARMGEDLLSFGTKVLVLGDPAQLPPVAGSGFFTEGKNPNVMLTDIHRQAKDNPIIAMATKVRNQENLFLGNYGNSSVVDKIDPMEACEADQILVGRNITRSSSNKRVRALRDITQWHPIAGDKLVCLRNNHEKGLLNGALWLVEDIGEVDQERIRMTLTPEEGGSSLEVEAHSHYFNGNGGALPWWERKEAEEFDFGYALTVHKSQGSQWENVLLFDEASCFKEDRWKWLYTAITRAANSVKVARL